MRVLPPALFSQPAAAAVSRDEAAAMPMKRPHPAAGKRLLFDTENKKIVVYDAIAGSIKTITYMPLLEVSNIAKDDVRVKGVQFPLVDRQNKAITIYSSRDRKLVKFTLADEYFAQLVKERSKGRIVIEVFPESKLGEEKFLSKRFSRA